MKRLLLLVCLVALVPTVPAADKKEAPVVPPKKGASETIELFNGKDLDGWVGHFRYWSVQDGAIVGKSTRPVPVSTYLLTERNFSDFRLKARVKLVQSEMHSGIAFWGRVASEQKDPATYAGHLVMFPIGLGHVGPVRPQRPARRRRRTGQEGRQAARLERPGHPRPGQSGARHRQRRRSWSTGAIRSRRRIKEGPIGLQLHANKEPQEVQFKGLKLTTFPDDKDVPEKIGDMVKK